MKRVLVVMGTRPEAVKLARVVTAIAATPGLATVTCATAQHREMLDEVLRLFGIVPEFDLDVMRDGQTLTFVTNAVLERVSALIAKVRPDAVIVQGDTATSMAAGLAGYYAQVPVGHVEAGLRTGDRYSPFPEEVMRRLLTQVATWHFAATATAVRALRAEGVSSSDVYLVGNPVVDAVLWMRERAPRADLGLRPGQRLILVTAHRRESFGVPLERICAALRTIVDRNEDAVVLYPVHPNPNVTGPVRRLLGGVERIRLIDPLPYDRFVGAMNVAYLLLTDSGGLQEEGPVLGKPVLVMRDKTERTELIEAGAGALVGTDTARIVSATERLLRDPAEYGAMAGRGSPFGDGHASEKIAAALLQLLAGAGDGADRCRVTGE